MDNKFFIYIITVTSLAIKGPGGGGGASITKLGHFGSYLPSHLY